MHLPAAYSLALLLYLFVLLPWGAWKSAKHLDRLRARKTIAAKRQGADVAEAQAAAMPTPARIYLNTMISMGLLLLLSVIAARQVDYPLFQIPAFGAREWIACAVWFVASFTVGLASRWWRSPEELKSMPALSLVPRTRNDWLAFIAVAFAAGVCEEAAYRGVAYQALAWSTGSTIAAALLSALAFSLAHRVQGYKTMVIVFVKGLLVQGLVVYTGTLVGAMVGHALLDVITAWRTRGLAAELERAD